MHTFEQSNGNLWHDGALLGTGYAGAPAGKNNPAMQGVRGVGPLPVGDYTIGKPTNVTHCGVEAFPLIPNAVTRAFITSLGRDPDAFFLHGDDIAHPGCGSEGCIVQARPVRDQVNKDVEAGDDQLQVVDTLDK